LKFEQQKYIFRIILLKDLTVQVYKYFITSIIRKMKEIIENI